MSVYDEPKQKAPHILPTGSHDQFSPELARPTKITNHPDTKPQDQPHDSTTEATPNQSSYTELLSSATATIADKAISAKNVVASKLGYGGKGGETEKSSQVGESGQKTASTMTEKLAPVCEKVSQAGSAVMSKMTGGGGGDRTEGGVKGSDKGVSVKEYLVEKLKPGDEDRALSEVISDVLQKRKKGHEHEKAVSRPVGEVVSDALHKRKEENESPEKASRPVGKVTESEEVAKRLGSSTVDEGSRERVDSGNVKVDSGNVSPGKGGVVDRLKGAVSSWLGTADEAQLHPSHAGNEGLSKSASGGEVGHGHEAGGE